MAEIEMVRLKPKVQCRFCDCVVVLLLSSYGNHITRRHPTQHLTAGEKREDIIPGDASSRPKRIAMPESKENCRYELRPRHAASQSDIPNDAPDIDDGELSDEDYVPSDSEPSSPVEYSNSSASSDDEYPIQSIIGHDDTRGVRRYLIHWEGYPREEASYIPGSWITGTIGRVSFHFAMTLICCFHARE